MALVILHTPIHPSDQRRDSLLRCVLSGTPMADIVFKGLLEWSWPMSVSKRTFLLTPKDWMCNGVAAQKQIIPYTGTLSVPSRIFDSAGHQKWSCICNGRFVTQIAPGLIQSLTSSIQADVILVHVTPDLMAYNEKALITGSDKLAGFRRVYSDAVEFVPISNDWPHCIFIKTPTLQRILNDAAVSREFYAFLESCQSIKASINSIKLGGQFWDLEKEGDLIDFCSVTMDLSGDIGDHNSGQSRFAKLQSKDCEKRAGDPKLIGRVLLGKNIRFGLDSVVIGPALIGDNVTIGDGTVIHSAVISPHVAVPRDQLIQNRVLSSPVSKAAAPGGDARTYDDDPARLNLPYISDPRNQLRLFRRWSTFSYTRFTKRILDIFAAGVVILLFFPFLLFIAAVIKLSSAGPVFYKARRQGRYGKVFKCLKFRTMMVGADDMQEKLRGLNQVDGPQFLMHDDPRVTNVGRFLRATHLDELPQFINVLLGQMSVVGPRPSPESENELCPSWRYARLSVRPGITGFWQVCGTREPLRDFQEWIYYDMKYVNEVSLKLDVWICYRTVKKIINRFFEQL